MKSYQFVAILLILNMLVALSTSSQKTPLIVFTIIAVIAVVLLPKVISRLASSAE